MACVVEEKRPPRMRATVLWELNGVEKVDACISHGFVMDFAVQSDPQNLERFEAGGHSLSLRYIRDRVVPS